MSYNPGDYDNFFQKYAYDADNRLSHAYSSLDGIIWNEAARYFYYLHGPLARTEYGDDKVQGTDYTYTMQGWLKSANLHGINTMLSEPGRDGSIIANIPSSQINGRMGRDAMAYTLGYHNNDYTSINGITFSDTWTNFGSNLLPSVPGPKGLYNGNIATMITDHKGSTSGISGYAYQYDQLHRIRQAKNYNYPNTNSDNSFNTQYNYNPDGNITSLKRYGNSGSTMDDFSNYNYGNSALQPNTLKSLTDNVVAGAYQNDFDGSQTYTYDKIGNLTANSDQNTTVHWDVYNKVKSSTNNIGNTFYKYDGTGSRVFKTFENSPNYYVKDAQGNVLSIYGEFTGFRCNQQIEKECHLYGSSRLGVEVVNRTCNDVVHNNYMLGFHTPTSTHYELSNHLGNVLTTVTGRKLGIDENMDNIVDYYKQEVIQASDYYPFGSEMPGRTYRNPLFSGTNDYRFGFNDDRLVLR